MAVRYFGKLILKVTNRMYLQLGENNYITIFYISSSNITISDFQSVLFSFVFDEM